LKFPETGEKGETPSLVPVSLGGTHHAHVATDGETYGHHFRGGERVLASALQAIEESGLARLTNYGEFLARRPPTHEAQVRENTAWSCAHGLGRWSEDCGCHTGSGGLGWTQAWRSPLRAALDGLRDELAAAYEQKGAELFFDPWAARNAYIAALLDPEPEVFSEVLRWHARRALSPSDEALARRLLEMQRFAMLMYTSCGWFFDDPSGLETTQILLYAARAIDLSDGLAPPSVESDFLDHLSRAASNDPAAGDARRIYQSAIARAKSESLSREA
jgi:alpha-amylase/alpha-mannosidase (GH57 family)